MLSRTLRFVSDLSDLSETDKKGHRTSPKSVRSVRCDYVIGQNGHSSAQKTTHTTAIDQTRKFHTFGDLDHDDTHSSQWGECGSMNHLAQFSAEYKRPERTTHGN
jgi:hypothetical protein